MPPRHSTKHLFYGYPAWVIAEWCSVSLQTARHWKSGIRAPGPGSLKLFVLHRDGRILTDDEWQGWGVLKGKLCDPEGHELTQGQLRAYAIVWQLAAEYGKSNSSAADALVRLASIDAPTLKARRSRSQAQASQRSSEPALRHVAS